MFLFLQAIRRYNAMHARIHYNVRGENVELVYHDVVDSDAESGPSEETGYHQYEDIDQHRVVEAEPSGETGVQETEL